MKKQQSLSVYIDEITHQWLKTLCILGFTLVPLFFILDLFIVAKESHALLPKFGVYRAITTILIFSQFLILRKSLPGKYSFLHGYLFTFIVSLSIAMMTVDLGGFNSLYYAGLNLVIIAVNMLLPWKSLHSAINGTITVGIYVFLNSIWGSAFDPNILINNLYFLLSTVIIASSINHVKYLLIKKEYHARIDLQKTKDALWGEMEIAKKIQTALLPNENEVGGYEIAAMMLPADEVGGDYYDIIKTKDKNWITIGDVSGHGVESGLIMMMTQTSVKSMINQNPEAPPSKVLANVNSVIKENITRLKADRYMTISLLSLNGKKLMVSGKHQDLIIYRSESKKIETIPTEGTWIGIIDDIAGYLTDTSVDINKGDLVLLFTDGITEAENEKGEMFGQERLVERLDKYSSEPVWVIMSKIINEVQMFQKQQDDDITLLIIKKQ